MYDRWFTIALLASEFGQIWAKLGLRKSRTTLGEIADCIIVQLPDMRPIDDVTPQLWHDVTPQLRLSANRLEMDGGTNVMITYDATKMDGTYSDGIINNTTLFPQMFMNI